MSETVQVVLPNTALEASVWGAAFADRQTFTVGDREHQENIRKLAVQHANRVLGEFRVALGAIDSDDVVNLAAEAMFHDYNTSGPIETHYKAWNGKPVPKWDAIDSEKSSVKEKWRHVAAKSLGLS